MRPRASRAAALAAALLVSGATPGSAQVGAVTPDLSITYILNDGLLLERDGQRVLIDALFRGQGTYATFPDSVMLEAMHAGAPPFDGADVVLVTHGHDDHFVGALVARYLQTHPGAAFRSTAPALQQLGAVDPALAAGGRAAALTPPAYLQAREEEIRGIRVRALWLNHHEPSFENLAYVVRWRGATILHMGDSYAQDVRSFAWDPAGVDVAFVDRWFFYPDLQAGVELLRDVVHARNVVLMHHVLARDLPGVDSLAERLRPLFPGGQVIVPRRPLEQFAITLTAPALTGTMARPLSAPVSGRPIAFVPNGQQVNPLVSYGAVSGDFDGDGTREVFFLNLASPEGSGDRVYRLAARGRLEDSGQVLADPGEGFMNPLAADVDGDGRPEVVTGSTIWQDDGHGRMSADSVTLGVRRELIPVGIADLNGDGRLDYLALVLGRSVQARVYLGDGAGAFKDSGERFGSGALGPGALADLDGDGDLDAVLGGWRNEAGDSVPNRVWINDGRGHFAWKGEAFDEGMRHAHAVALADVDGDGDADLLLGTQSPPFLTVYLNRGDGHFERPGRTFGAAGVERIAPADLDGDGDLDLVLACHGPNEVWQNDGRGNFTDTGLRLGNDWSWGLEVADLDGDGRPDLVIGNMGLEEKNGEYVRHGRPAEIWLNRTPRAPGGKVDK